MDDDMFFTEVIKNGLKVFTAQFLADEFKVSQGTIKRWVKGKSLPYVSIRKHIVGRIIKLQCEEVKNLCKQIRGE